MSKYWYRGLVELDSIAVETILFGKHFEPVVLHIANVYTCSLQLMKNHALVGNVCKQDCFHCYGIKLH